MHTCFQGLLKACQHTRGPNSQTAMWPAVLIATNAVFWVGYVGYAAHLGTGDNKVWRGSFAEMEAAERGERRFAEMEAAKRADA